MRGACVILAALGLLLPAGADANDPRLGELTAAVQRARDEKALRSLPDASWGQYVFWGYHNQDELVWLAGAVKAAFLDLTGVFHVGRPVQLPRDDPGIRRLLLIDIKTKTGGKNPDEARREVIDLLDRAAPDRSPELAEALFLFTVLERRALVDRHPGSGASSILGRMTAFFRKVEPQALDPGEVVLADTPEEAREQEWERTFRALKAYLNDRPDWGPALALEYARALDMSWEGFDSFHMTVHAFNVVNSLLALAPRLHSEDALWIAPWGTLYLGLFCSRIQEYDRALGYFNQGIGLVETIAKANVSVSDPRVVTRADLEAFRHPDSLYGGISADSAAADPGRMLIKWTYLMEAQERFGDLRPGERGWDRPEGKAIAANGVPTAVGYETLYDTFSADAVRGSAAWPLRAMGDTVIPLYTTRVDPARRTYVWKTPDGKVVRREFQIFGGHAAVGPTFTWNPMSRDWSGALNDTRYDLQQAQDQSIALANLPASPQVAETVHEVRAATFRRSGREACSFVVGLASVPGKEAWFDGATADFSLLDANRYPVERSEGSSMLGDHARHRLPNGQDVYLADFSASGIPPGRYGWRVSLRSGDKALRSWVSNGAEEIVIPEYGRRGLQISDVRFQIPVEVRPGGSARPPSQLAEPEVHYLWTPFQEVFTPGSSDPHGRNHFNFTVDVYNLSTGGASEPAYQTHYAIFNRSVYQDTVRPLLESQRKKPRSLSEIFAPAVVQDVSGPRFCQVVEVGEFTVPPHAVGQGADTLLTEQHRVDPGERHLSVTVEVGMCDPGAYTLLMEVRDLNSGEEAWRSVSFAVRPPGARLGEN